MINRRRMLICTVLGVVAVCAASLSLLRPPSQEDTAEVKVQRAGNGRQAPVESHLQAHVLPTVVTSSATETLNNLSPNDREQVYTFLAETPGPVDNYLLKLEEMVNVANVRYGQPDQKMWARALPVARVLENSMCDCAQRNWLNQFIVLGEAGLAEDLDRYHAQGQVMASIGRFNADTVVSQ